MYISSKSRYALRALVELELRTGGAGHPVRICDLAAGCDLPEQFLEQLFAALRRAGILRSHRGVGGGFTFAQQPDRVTVLDVVTVLDGPLAEAGAEWREGDEWCAADHLWHEAEAALEGVLAACTVADLTERERQHRAGQPMYEI
jgi:Rrf2 family cysteine metabolism transcriptional repressor